MPAPAYPIASPAALYKAFTDASTKTAHERQHLDPSLSPEIQKALATLETRMNAALKDTSVTVQIVRKDVNDFGLKVSTDFHASELDFWLDTTRPDVPVYIGKSYSYCGNKQIDDANISCVTAGSLFPSYDCQVNQDPAAVLLTYAAREKQRETCFKMNTTAQKLGV